MAIFKNSMAYKIRAYIKLNPNAKPSTIAEYLGIPASVVYSTAWRDKKLGAPKRRYTKKAKVSEVVQTIPEGTWKRIAVVSSNAPFDSASIPLPITMAEPKVEVDMVNSPPHYKVGGIEVIDFIQAKLTTEEFRGYLQGNVLKYSSRVGYKGDASEDLAKLVWYANKLQETLAT
jgi:hypothetical protein